MRSDALRYRVLAQVAWCTLLLTSVTWLANTSSLGVVEDGGDIDGPLAPVKAVLALAAVAAAFAVRSPRRFPVTAGLFIAYASVSALGSLLDDSGTTGLVRSVRLILTLLAVLWFSSSMSQRQLSAGVLVVTSGVVVVALLFHSVDVDGRLAGYLPPLHPNVLAQFALIGAITTIGLWSRAEIHTVVLVVLLLLDVAAVVLSGSRTALAELLAAVLFVAAASVVQPRSSRLLLPGIFGAIGITMFVVNDLLNGAPVLLSLLTRSGSGTVDPTLSGRTNAWALALQQNDTFYRMVAGQGLQVKTVVTPIGNTFQSQGFDNSWVSLYVEGGLIGLALVGIAVLGLLVGVLRSGSVEAQAIVIVALTGSWTESSLADITLPLVVLLAYCWCTDRTRSDHRAPDPVIEHYPQPEPPGGPLGRHLTGSEPVPADPVGLTPDPIDLRRTHP